MRKTLACLLIPTFITFYHTNKANALSTEVENKVINNINNNTNEDNFSLMTRYLNCELEYQRDTFQAKVHRDIKSKELIKQKVNERIDKQIERQEQAEQERIEKENSYNIGLIFSFYTDLAEENGGHEGITCTGERLQYGHLASNVWNLGVRFESKDGEIFTVADKGGSHFDSWNRVDCYIPRQTGESDYQYYKRVNNMGHKTITVKLIRE